MGGNSEEPRIGTKYYKGFTFVTCRQHDGLLAIEMNGKNVWRGRVRNDQIRISANNAFGGDEREGGFSGRVDVQDGRLDQSVNSYLDGAKSTLTSALRGCVSMVFRKPYIGANTARMPKIRTKHLNIKGVARGWQTIKASIDPELEIDNVAFFCTLDANNTALGATFSRSRDGLAAFIRSLKDSGKSNSFYISVTRPSFSGGDIQRAFYNVSTSTAYEEIAIFVESITKSSTNLSTAHVDLTNAQTFFDTHSGGGSGLSFSQPLLADEITSEETRYIIFSAISSSISSSTYDSIVANTGARVATVATLNAGGSSPIANMTDFAGQVDVESVDDVFQVNTSPAQSSSESDAGIRAAITKSLLVWEDCNPAHIIRCLWTDPERGGPVAESEIGDSFETFADLCIEEGLGLTADLTGLGPADAERLDVERHCDAVSYRSTKTGKIEVVAIRDDYVVGDLFVLDSDIVSDWSQLSRPRLSEIPNQLTVTYTRRDGRQGSVTRTNIAGVRRAGRVIRAETASYPACTSEELAIRFCLRDLRTISADILSGNLPLTYLPAGLEVGQAVLINEPLLGYDNIVMRVSETRTGKHNDSTATITVSEDKFATTQRLNIVQEEIGSSSPAVAPIYRIVEEASYLQGVLRLGQAAIDDELEVEPDLGRFFATGAKANGDQLDATLATSADGVTWDANGIVDFEPYGVLTSDLSSEADVVSFLVSTNNTQDEIRANQFARIGDEIMRIDNMVDQGDGTVLVTVGRGCLDGPPSKHVAGAAFIIVSEIAPLGQNYIAGQSVQVKMLSRTGEDAQTLDAATTDTVVFASRAIRPYPVGKLQSDGSYSIAEGATGGTLTWKNRDRTLQTTPLIDDHTADNIGPETGVSYVPFRRVYDDTGAFTETEFASVSQALTYDFTTDPAEYDSSTDLVGVGIRVKRGSFVNLHDVELQFKPLLPATLTATSVEDNPT